MKKDIHPKYYHVTASCTTCGTKFETNSTVEEIKVDVCSSCHPFYVGKSGAVMAAGRVEEFNKKYNKK